MSFFYNETELRQKKENFDNEKVYILSLFADYYQIREKTSKADFEDGSIGRNISTYLFSKQVKNAYYLYPDKKSTLIQFEKDGQIKRFQTSCNRYFEKCSNQIDKVSFDNPKEDHGVTFEKKGKIIAILFLKMDEQGYLISDYYLF